MAICHLQNTRGEAVGKGEQESHHSPAAFAGSAEALKHFAVWPATLPQLLLPGRRDKLVSSNHSPSAFPHITSASSGTG